MPVRSRTTEASRAITDLAVEILRERGEPARHERLLGEILVGLDRAGHLRRLIAATDAMDGGTTSGRPDAAMSTRLDDLDLDRGGIDDGPGDNDAPGDNDGPGDEPDAGLPLPFDGFGRR